LPPPLISTNTCHTPIDASTHPVGPNSIIALLSALLSALLIAVRDTHHPATSDTHGDTDVNTIATTVVTNHSEAFPPLILVHYLLHCHSLLHLLCLQQSVNHLLLVVYHFSLAVERIFPPLEHFILLPLSILSSVAQIPGQIFFSTFSLFFVSAKNFFIYRSVAQMPGQYFFLVRRNISLKLLRRSRRKVTFFIKVIFFLADTFFFRNHL
jgi:hypothetical protein